MSLFCNHTSGGKAAALLGGIGIGAALMYALDPQGGRRRRAMARDKAVSLASRTGEAMARRSRDLSNRAKGVASEMRSALGRSGDGADAAEAAAASDGSGGKSISQGNGSGKGKGNGNDAGDVTSRKVGASPLAPPSGSARRPEEPEL